MNYTTEQEVRYSQDGNNIANVQKEGADTTEPKLRRRPLAELNIVDNFLFNELTLQEDDEQSREFCSILVETLLGRKLENVTITPQRSYQGTDTDKHGICVDVQIEADLSVSKESGSESDREIYDIEPNCYKDDDARRARYYTALIDSYSLQSGKKYKKMKDLCLLFITTYDPFGEDSMVYTIERHCREFPDLTYDDGISIIFMYAYGKRNIPNQKVKDMLLFLAETSHEHASGDKDREAIYKMVEDLKNSRKVGIRYMKQFELLDMYREAGLEEGREKGREEGRQEGREEGREEGHIEGCEEGIDVSTKVLKRHNSGKASKEIAEELNIPVERADDIIRRYEMA